MAGEAWPRGAALTISAEMFGGRAEQAPSPPAKGKAGGQRMARPAMKGVFDSDLKFLNGLLSEKVVQVASA